MTVKKREGVLQEYYINGATVMFRKRFLRDGEEYGCLRLDINRPVEKVEDSKYKKYNSEKMFVLMTEKGYLDTAMPNLLSTSSGTKMNIEDFFKFIEEYPDFLHETNSLKTFKLISVK